MNTYAHIKVKLGYVSWSYIGAARVLPEGGGGSPAQQGVCATFGARGDEIRIFSRR